MAINKARYWTAVLYPENMLDDWEEEVGDLVQLPYAYCVHDADSTSKKQEERKVHVHMILVFPNTTTQNHAFNVYNQLAKPGFKALSACQPVISIRGQYDYLIHDTETARKQGKHLYPESNRITGNNFDIGAYETLGIQEKNAMCRELCDCIIANNFKNFTDFYIHAIVEYVEKDSNYFEVLKSYSSLFEKLTRANYQRSYEG